MRNTNEDLRRGLPLSRLVFAVAALLFFLINLACGTAKAATTTFNPLRVDQPVAPCPTKFAELPMPVIAWGADMVTVHANGDAVTTARESVFAKEGLSIKLYRQDDFKQQVADFLACKTPFLRAELGMLAQANDILAKDARTAPFVFYDVSFSFGGDALVGKENIRRPEDLRGKVIAVQEYGPHIYYLLRVLADAGLKPGIDVTIKLVPDLMQTDSTSVSPAKVFRDDPSVSAAFMIIPDALALTSGGTVGTGGEDSVRGAHILMTTKTANRIVKDVIAVRSDYYEAHKREVDSIVHGLLVAKPEVTKLMKEKGAGYQPMLSAAASLLLDSSTAVDDMAGMWADAEVSGYPENVKFFTDATNSRNFERMLAEIRNMFATTGLVTKPLAILAANLDYAQLATGLSDTAGVEVARFDAAAVQQVIERRAQQSTTEGELFSFSIYFGPNQNTFSADQYGAKFDQALSAAAAHGGALLVIEGHSDPLGYLKQKKDGASPLLLNQQRQAAKNLSFARANAVKDSLIAYAAMKGITIDASQFGVTGLGVSQPNTPKCTRDASGDIDLSCAPRSEKEWADTRRVVFKIINVEAETDVFRPL